MEEGDMISDLFDVVGYIDNPFERSETESIQLIPYDNMRHYVMKPIVIDSESSFKAVRYYNLRCKTITDVSEFKKTVDRILESITPELAPDQTAAWRSCYDFLETAMSENDSENANLVPRLLAHSYAKLFPAHTYVAYNGGPSVEF